MPALAAAQAVGTPSYQSLLARNYALQVQISMLQAQIRKMQAARPPSHSTVRNQPRLYEFPVSPFANSQPLIVPRLTNIPDSRVILLGR